MKTRAAVLEGRYELVEVIGTGGMAEVWKGRDTRLQRDVAVKLIPGAHDPSHTRRIMREAKAMAALSHPNVLAVFDYGEDESSRPFIVTELIDGPDLHKVLAKEGKLDEARVREIMRGVLLGVEVAHRSGIVHGDLKPANVLMGNDGPKVGDFGVARILDDETGNTTIAATPTFAAPEVLKGNRATPAADIYSAACLAFQLLTGRAPYEGSNGWEVASKHIESPVPHVREFVDVSPDLDAAIHRGMAKDPKRRFTSAVEFARTLEATPLPETVPVVAQTPAQTPESTEVIGPAPDLAKVALFGPLWIWTKRARDRFHGLVERPSKAALAILCAFLVILAVMAFRSSGPAQATTPDLHGMTVPQAVAALQKVGLKWDVSYRPVTSGPAGVVVETAPVRGTKLARGTSVHVIATALVHTPAPSASPARSVVRPFPAGGGGRVTHGKKKH